MRNRLLPFITSLVLLIGCGGRAPRREFVEQAERLHRSAFASAVASDPDLNEYFQMVGQRLIAAAKEVAPNKASNDVFSRMRFHLVNSDTVNVFTTGGGHVYFSRRLLRHCDSEEEMAAAMAHALAHALNFDVEEIDLNPDPKMPLPLVVWQFVTNRFTQRQEQRADRLALRLYTRGGWDPALFRNLFVKLGDVYAMATAPDRVPPANRGDLAGPVDAKTPEDGRYYPVADRRTFLSLRNQATSEGASRPDDATEVFLLAFPNCILANDLPEQRTAQELLRPPPPPTVPLEPS